MFKYYNNLGFNNPYYYNDNGKFKIQKKFAVLIKCYKGEKKIDPIAVTELLNKNYIFADRTLIQGIQHTPWLAKPNKQFNDWEYDNLPEHGLSDIEEKEIAKTLFKIICDEMQLYIGNKKRVGILLSGGMDSRMVAGALDFLIKNNKLINLEVTGLTWGNKGTRDVVYAKEIAQRLNWNWKHYIVSAKDLRNNITETAIHGCEYSPIHLHAIPQIRDDNSDIEVILAGSYGDSIGRAEYSGTKIKLLKPILRNIFNIGGILNQTIFAISKKYIENDIIRYHKQFPQNKQYAQNELDYQLHYMRKMLNPCMKLLTEKMEFHQVFAHPNVYRYMWSIDPKRRNDNVYKYLMDEFSTKLNDLPWARTGKIFGETRGKPDKYLKKHNSYSHIIQKEIFNEIESLVISDEIKQLGIINLNAVKILLRLIKHLPTTSIFYLEKLIWLASLSEFVRIYNIKDFENFKYIKYKNRKKISISLEFIFIQLLLKFKSILNK